MLRERARALLVQATQTFKGRAALHLGFSMSDDSPTAVGPGYLDSLGDAEVLLVVREAQHQATACITAPTWTELPREVGALPPDSPPRESRAEVRSTSGSAARLRALHLSTASPNQDAVSLAFAYPSAAYPSAIGQDQSRILQQIRRNIEATPLASNVRASVLPGLSGLALEVSSEQLVTYMRAIREVFASLDLQREPSPSPSGPGPDLGACDRYRLEHLSVDSARTSRALHFYWEGALTGASTELELVSVTPTRGAHLYPATGQETP
jgi:hypothetical protein